MNENTCPDCGGELVEWNGPHDLVCADCAGWVPVDVICERCGDVKIETGPCTGDFVCVGCLGWRPTGLNPESALAEAAADALARKAPRPSGRRRLRRDRP